MAPSNTWLTQIALYYKICIKCSFILTKVSNSGKLEMDIAFRSEPVPYLFIQAYLDICNNK